MPSSTITYTTAALCPWQNWSSYSNAGWTLAFGSSAGTVQACLGSGSASVVLTTTATVANGAW